MTAVDHPAETAPRLLERERALGALRDAFAEADAGERQDDFSETKFVAGKIPSAILQGVKDRNAWKGFGKVTFYRPRPWWSGVTGGGVKVLGPVDVKLRMGIEASKRVVPFDKAAVSRNLDLYSIAKWRSGVPLLTKLTTAPPLLPAAGFNWTHLVKRGGGGAVVASVINIGVNVYDYGWGAKKEKGLASKEFAVSTTADVTAGLGIVAVSTIVGSFIPVPGLGTAIGFAVGVGLQYAYQRWGKEHWEKGIDKAGAAIADGWREGVSQAKASWNLAKKAWSLVSG